MTTKNREKLIIAIDELKANGAKINPSSVEKKAGVSNGSLSYYDDLYQEVRKLKLNSIKNTKKDAKIDTLKNHKNRALHAKREAESKLAKLKAGNKIEKLGLIDAIANLTWALHKSQRARAEQSVSTDFCIKNLKSKNCD